MDGLSEPHEFIHGDTQHMSKVSVQYSATAVVAPPRVTKNNKNVEKQTQD